MCGLTGTHEDEVTGNRFCPYHAGPLSMSAHDVDVYSLALRLHAAADTQCPLPNLDVRGVA